MECIRDVNDVWVDSLIELCAFKSSLELHVISYCMVDNRKGKFLAPSLNHQKGFSLLKHGASI